MINRNNAEAFFLDYYEGNLSQEQVAELFAFLKVNPDLREVFEAFGDVNVADSSSHVPHSSLHLPDFSFLKKDSAGDQHALAEQWMVDYVEGVISAENKAALEKYFTEYPAKRNDLALLENTILRPDGNEVFGDLSSLKRDAEITAENFSDYAIADVEGTISTADKNKLDAFIASNPEFVRELALYKATKLDESLNPLIPQSLNPDFSFLKKTALVVNEGNIIELLVAKAEGELSASDEAAVNEYIARFPEYKIELVQIERTKLQPDTSIVFEGKANLRKGQLLINESNFEEYALSASEGLLNGEELKAFHAFVLANPKYKKTVAAYAAARLQPDMAVMYDDKASLKRKQRGGYIWWTANVRFAAAAIIVLVFGIYLFVKFSGNGVNPGEQPFAKIDTAGNGNGNDIIVPDVNKNDGLASVDANVNSDATAPVNYNVAFIGDTAEVPANNVALEVGGPITVQPADFKPERANDAVNYSNALYAALVKVPAQNASPVKDDRYITPGQFAMRWVKNKIDAGNPQMGGIDQPENPGDVDGLDITESAINRVGQSAANGNVSMKQREDGTYLQLWKYSVRVAR